MMRMETEVLVVGAGIAGCAAAFTSARKRRTVLVSAGGSATSLSSGCIDFHADGKRERAGPFLEELEKSGLELAEGGHVMTLAGLERRADIRQGGMLTLEEAKGADGVSVIDLPWLRSSHGRMTVHGLRTAGMAAEMITVGAGPDELLERCGAEELGQRLAASLPECRRLVALPALWDRVDAAKILDIAGRAKGCTIRELVGPVGPQGLRLQRAAEAAARPASVMTGTELLALEFEGDRCVGARLGSGLREIEVRCAAVILATGGPLISRQNALPGVDMAAGAIPSLGVQAPFLLSCEGAAVRKGRRTSNVMICGSALAENGYLEGKGMGDCILSGIDAAERAEGVR
jgi:glycine/D-amino acid oxidase-like deaminating enzyme